ncbi:ubl carboxyl-terminal hydrolase 18 isoform X2 [Hoplias malabaricus]|uniref:ubl carboxyl-terminal hydrolase 18 isoform X2 n=1 Tax=Hoplias malabaricus TaxID=27720 RepID=UPI0034631BB5
MGMSWPSRTLWDVRRMYGVRGLMNSGLSCCINALLQCFSATTELVDLLNRWQTQDESGDPYNVPLQLKKALQAMKDQHQHAPHYDFLNCLHHNYIYRQCQHDADELFLAILNLIQQQMSDSNLAAEIKRLYRIEMEAEIRCLECTYKQCVPTFFLSLPLHLREGKNKLEECISLFLSEQQLEIGEEFWCDRCDEKQPTAQAFKIVTLPSILCIHLKRFRSDRGFSRKLECEVSFPMSFNMAENDKKENPAAEMREASYKLYAVIVHSGSCAFGHYTAYIHSVQEGAWYYIDDSSVYKASWKEVQGTYGGFGTAYMLLYRRNSSETVQESSG